MAHCAIVHSTRDESGGTLMSQFPLPTLQNRPPRLPPHSDIFCHNELHDVVFNLAGKAFTPLHVCDNLLIHSVRAAREVKA